MLSRRYHSVTSDVAVASYLAKYATKSTEPVGVPPGRITADNASTYATSRTHQGRLIAARLQRPYVARLAYQWL